MIAVLAALCTPATAQSDNPWGTVLDEPSAPAPAVTDLPEEDAPPPRGPEGYRLAPFAAPTGVGLDTAFVVGGDGGTTAVGVGARVRIDEGWSFAARLPFAAFRTTDGRDTGLGNVALSAWFELPVRSRMHHMAGVETTISTSGDAYTWVHRADELWPGGGADAVWQGAFHTNDAVTWLARGALGLHVAEGYAPYPDVYARIQVAGGLDYALAQPVGFTLETALGWWDVSPWELSALGRVDPIEGLRLRGGIVVPFLVWAGTQPADLPPGARELTAVLELTSAL